MVFNLKEKCHEAKDREFFYGAKINKEIIDVYMGVCYLEPGETDRKAGPGRGHEELLYVANGRIKVKEKENEFVLNEGQVYFLPDGKKVKLDNLTDEKCYFMISGGHTKLHKH